MKTSDDPENADDDFLWSAYVNLLTAAAMSGGRVPLYFFGAVVVALGYEVRAHKEELGCIANQLGEIDRTLEGSLDELIAIVRDFTKAVDRLLGCK